MPIDLTEDDIEIVEIQNLDISTAQAIAAMEDAEDSAASANLDAISANEDAAAADASATAAAASAAAALVSQTAAGASATNAATSEGIASAAAVSAAEDAEDASEDADESGANADAANASAVAAATSAASALADANRAEAAADEAEAIAGFNPSNYLDKATYDPNNDGKVTSAVNADVVPWSGVSGTPTTMVGYGITDGLTASDLTPYAPINSPALTGNPTAPTQLGTDNSTKIATTAQVQAALSAYIAAQDILVFKGFRDCSANPNYPAADAGHVYRVSVAGKIGGASGVNVEMNDMLTCLVDGTAAGTQAAVGANWQISQVNIDGAVTGPTSAVNLSVAGFDGTSGKIIKQLSASEIQAAAGLATSDTPQFAGINIGHATDTTITRDSAGQIAVEGVKVLMATSDILIPTVITVPNSGLHLLDTDGSHDLIVKPGSNLTADRTLTVTTGDNDRTLDISGASVTVSAFAATFLDDANAAAVKATLGITSSDTFGTQLLHVVDEKGSTSDGGSSAATTWSTRDLNTVRTNEITSASLSSNQISLPAGTYIIESHSPLYKSGRFRVRLWNVTDSAATLLGTSACSDAGDNTGAYSHIRGKFTIAGTKSFRIEYYCAAGQATTGLGTAVGSSAGSSVYTEVLIWKVA